MSISVKSWISATLCAGALAACAVGPFPLNGGYATPARARMTAHGADLVEFSARLSGAPGDAQYALQIEVIQSDHPPEAIAQFLLSSGAQLPAPAPALDRICGFRGGFIGGDCKYIAIYEIPIAADWARQAADGDGLTIRIAHADGVIHDGPFISPADLKRFLSRLGDRR